MCYEDRTPERHMAARSVHASMNISSLNTLTKIFWHLRKAPEDFSNASNNTPQSLSESIGGRRANLERMCLRWLERILLLLSKKQKSICDFFFVFSTRSYGCVGEVHDNLEIINGSPNKVLINAEAGIEHIWIFFCSKYWNNQQIHR